MWEPGRLPRGGGDGAAAGRLLAEGTGATVRKGWVEELLQAAGSEQEALPATLGKDLTVSL